MKLTIEVEGKDTEVIEASQYFVITDKGCSYSGSFEWLIGKLYYTLQEIKKKYNAH